MNTAVISGRLVRDAMANGADRTAVQFTIAAKYGYNATTKEDRVEFVPCVIFNPSDALNERLVNAGKGTFVEFEGRVASSSYQKNGATVYTTNIVVNNRTFTIVTTPERLPLE